MKSSIETYRNKDFILEIEFKPEAFIINNNIITLSCNSPSLVITYIRKKCSLFLYIHANMYSFHSLLLVNTYFSRQYQEHSTLKQGTNCAPVWIVGIAWKKAQRRWKMLLGLQIILWKMRSVLTKFYELIWLSFAN